MLPLSQPMSREVSPEIERDSGEFVNFPDFGDDHVGLLDFIDQQYGSGFDKPQDATSNVGNSAAPATTKVVQSAALAHAGVSAEDFPDFGNDYPGFLDFIDQKYGSGFNELDDGMPPTQKVRQSVTPASNKGQSAAPAQKKRRRMTIGDGFFLAALIGLFVYALLNSLSFRITAGALTASWFAIGLYIEQAWSEDFSQEKTGRSTDCKEEESSQKKGQ